ncbi:hypothetical protein K488DRAFT_49752 [Vararia minispora EC-137]|uniref:Uncharacterized protein n=1 Tax=Vararia minispora EC-137 TaxID=1314806 RepID=A0ACB8QKY2_9AGAM|nr:hypothetical protein K488DRAFT_49752 [Vararia minispora EC-137]
MDELVQHCLHEIAFDGDLGCNVPRLRTYVEDFYTRAGQPQTVDDAFFGFVWTLLVRQPSVRVGTVPEDVTAEVYIAPQPIKRKKKEKGEETEDLGRPEIKLEMAERAKERGLGELLAEHGDALRVAVDPQTTFVALTGSHVRTSKLSEMVYTALQLISRGRAAGLSVVELGRKTGYDQKACWYLVSQLVDLGLVVKLRRGGVGANFCVHKHFFERERLWQEIRDEAAAAAEGVEYEDGAQDDDEYDGGAANVKFDAMDARHLSSLEIVKARIVKLLKASDGFMHASQNLILKIGFQDPHKSDRRFFQTRLRELIDQGVIERVTVPHPSPRKAKAKVQCIRLVNPDGQPDVQEEVDEPLEQGELILSSLTTSSDDHTSETSYGELRADVTLHKQMVDLLEQAGTAGMTLNDLATTLHNFDKRTLELLLSRLEKSPPPPHLTDLHVTQMMETHGKERRYRYYTLAAYRDIITREGLDDTDAYAGVSLERAHGFAVVKDTDFYETEEQRDRFVNEFKGGNAEKPRKSRGRPQKDSATARKGDTLKGRKRKREEMAEGDAGEDVSAPPLAKKRRGRPPRADKGIAALTTTVLPQPSEATPAADPEASSAPAVPPREETTLDGAQSDTLAPKKRGRPRKHPLLEDSASASATPKRRGRPPKNSLSTAGVTTEREDQAAIIVTEQGRSWTSPMPADTPAPVLSAGLLQPVAVKPTQPVAQVIPRRSARTKKPVIRDEPELSELTSIEGSPEPGGAKGQAGEEDDAIGSSTQVEPTLESNQSPAASTSPSLATPLAGLMEVDQPAQVEGPAPAASQPSPSSILPVLGPSESSTRSTLTSNEACLADSQVAVPLDIPIDPVLLSESGPHGRSILNGRPVNRSMAGRPRGNVSLMRRENEFLKLLNDFGGVASPSSKEFIDAHLVYMGRLAAVGEATSGLPQIRIDKRTCNATLDSLELKGKIKVLRTAIPVVVGAPRHVRVAYLPSIEKEQLDEFMAKLPRSSLAHSAPSKTAKKTPMDKGDSAANAARADKLSQLDDDTLREVFLTERTTLSQLYGFIPAKALRARQVHFSALEALEKEVPSIHVVSKEHRIISTSLYFNDISLKTYCSIISTLDYNEELTRQLSTEDGKHVRVSGLPQELYHSLQIGKARARARLLDLFNVLHEFRIAIPLRPSTAEDAPIKCMHTNSHPAAFEPWSEGRNTTNKHAVPVYWRFSDNAPLYLWVLSGSSPPFWRDARIGSLLHAEAYWAELEKACTSRHDAENVHCPEVGSATGPQITSTRISRSLRRQTSWRAEYEMTWHQRHYLRRYVNVATADTPLENAEHGAETLTRLARITSIPKGAMSDFFTKARAKQQREIERVRARHKVLQEVTTEEKAYSAQHAVQVQAQKEADWEDLVAHAYPEPLQGTRANRVARVKTRFMHGGSASPDKWETEIRRAIQEADMLTEAALATATGPVTAPGAELSSFAASGKSVRDLISEQRPAPGQSQQVKKKAKQKGKGKERSERADAEGPKRRSRFLWNREYDELAQDAMAIIRARCKDSGRVELSALDQVFPGTHRNSVRQRVASMREQPSVDSYLKRLEERWADLWRQYRGTEELPDPDPMSSNNFDLVKHIEFLRKHVDKTAIRVGFAGPRNSVVLPADVVQLEAAFDVVTKPAAPTFDFVWNLAVEEAREKGMLQHAFYAHADEIPPSYDSNVPVKTAESALKMVFGTPNDRYDPEVASALLRGFGEQTVALAKNNLLARGVLSKLVRDPTKSRPGRTLKISDVNANALGGSISSDTFQDASTLEALCKEPNLDWREWPLLASDGDLAMLIQAVSSGKAAFKVDASNGREARRKLDWNSKKNPDDDDLETSVLVKFFGAVESNQPSPASVPSTSIGPQPAPVDIQGLHGFTTKGDPACCRTVSDGIVNCDTCLCAQAEQVLTGLSEPSRGLCEKALAHLIGAGQDGLTKMELMSRLSTNIGLLSIALDQLVDASLPLAFPVGYGRMVLVAAQHIRQWTITVSEEPLTFALPRRWMDVAGRQIPDIWESALRALIGIIIFRPGISQEEMRWRLRSVYDAHEIIEVLKALLDDGFIRRMATDGSENSLLAPTQEEERHTFWFLGDRPWYQA